MALIKPPALLAGDTVGIWSPSGAIDAALRPQFERAVSVLQRLGFKVRVGAHVFSKHFYSAGTRAERLEDLHSLWRDPDVKMVLMSQGGETAANLLDGIDYELLRANPKVLAGMSDGTVILNAVAARAGLVTFHGPDLLWTFGRAPSQFFTAGFSSLLQGAKPLPFSANPAWRHEENAALRAPGWHCVRAGRATGLLIGGHIDCFNYTCLAGHGPDFDGAFADAILFLEGTENIAYLDRQFSVLRLNGIFGKISGLVLGWFEGSEDADVSKRRTVAEMALEVSAGFKFPILQISDLGHNVENLTLPLGVPACIDAEKIEFSLTETAVSI